MSNTSYQVIRHPDGGFQVKLTKPGDLPRTAVGFATLAEANAWVARDRRLARMPDPSIPRHNPPAGPTLTGSPTHPDVRHRASLATRRTLC